MNKSLRIGLLSGVVAATLLLTACKAKEEEEQAPTVTVQVGAAENQTIERKVNSDATLYPLEQAAIAPKISGPISKLYVNRGSRVHQGELLAELESSDLAGAVTENQGGYDQAQADYQAAVQKAQADLTVAKETVDTDQKVYDARVSLLRQGAIAAKDVDDAQIALTQAQNEYETAQKQLEVKAAEGQLTAAKGRAASANAGLAYSKITSPIDGVVTDRPFNLGETAQAGTPILTVMNLSQVVARAHVDQRDAATLKVGDEATLTAPGEAAPIKGKVTLVSPALDANGTTVEVWVQATNPGERLRPGTSVQVSMVAQSVPHAIVAPAESIVTDENGDTSVIVLDTDNSPHKKKVMVGIRDGDDVQITKGLSGGERVVTVGAFELANEDDPVLAKTKIQVQAPKVPDEDDDEDE